MLPLGNKGRLLYAILTNGRDFCDKTESRLYKVRIFKTSIHFKYPAFANRWVVLVDDDAYFFYRDVSWEDVLLYTKKYIPIINWNWEA